MRGERRKERGEGCFRSEKFFDEDNHRLMVSVVIDVPM